MPLPAFGHEPLVVFEDDCLLAVYKPPRLHSAPLAGGGGDLASWVFGQRPRASFDRGRAPQAAGTGDGPATGGSTAGAGRKNEGGLFHRLDFETSGLVLFALDQASLAFLLTAQDSGLVEKTYRALAYPSLLPLPGSKPSRGRPLGCEEGLWDEALSLALQGPDFGAGAAGLVAMAEGRVVESHFRPFGSGGSRVACLGAGEGPLQKRGRRGHGSPERLYRSNILAMRAVDSHPAGACLEIDVGILRGFRHQIRAQLAWIGLPLVGDEVYGGRPFGRLCLHAWRISLPHPRSGEALSIECPMEF